MAIEAGGALDLGVQASKWALRKGGGAVRELRVVIRSVPVAFAAVNHR
jgi:hypothetical protein